MKQEYIVILKDKIYINNFKSFLKCNKIYYEYLNDSNSFLIKTNKKCIDCISRLFYVADVDNNLSEDVEIEEGTPYIPDGPDDPSDPTYYLNWGIEKLNIPSLWKKGYTGKGVNVAVIDSGIVNHEYLDVKGNVSFVVGEDPTDILGHGTMVAGVIAARGFEENCYGIAYDCNLYNVKVITKDHRSRTWDICEGIQWCIDNNMDVVNISITWNYIVPDEELTALQEVVKRAEKAGVILVFSTGNDGVSPLFPPSDYKPSLAIGASTAYDEVWEKSNYGIGIDFVAPGVGITTTSIPTVIPPYNIKSKFSSVNGTSFAAPQVTGLIALLLSYDRSLTFNEILNMLAQSAVKIDEEVYSIKSGYGRVSAPNI